MKYLDLSHTHLTYNQIMTNELKSQHNQKINTNTEMFEPYCDNIVHHGYTFRPIYTLFEVQM